MMTNPSTDFPQQLVIETTAACNQACVFCGRSYMSRPKKNMSREMFERIVEEVAAENPYTEVWPTFMGEALLLGNKLFEMIAYAKSLGLKKLTLNTNGTRMNEKIIEGLLSCGVDRLIISCDAHTAETHARVRPARDPRHTVGLEGIYKNIMLLIETMRRQNLSSPLLELQFSLFEENEHEAEAFRNFWVTQGVVVKVRPKVYWSGTVQGGDHRITLKDRTPCMWAMDSAAIQWNGNVVMCPIDCDGKYVAGNITQQSLKDIWNGSLKWIRTLHLDHRFSELPQVCRECPDWKVKKAHAYYPDEHSKQVYEDYISLGRTFTKQHYWQEDEERIT